MPLELTPKQPPYYQTGDGISIKQYIALITQAGTNAPTAIILKNTLSGTPTLTRLSTGQYRVTLTGEFPLEKTVPILSQNNSGATIAMITNYDSPDYLNILTVSAGTPADDQLFTTPLEITVYP